MTSPLPHTIRFRRFFLTVTSPCPRTFGFCYLYPFSHRLSEEILATITLIIASKRTGLVRRHFIFPQRTCLKLYFPRCPPNTSSDHHTRPPFAINSSLTFVQRSRHRSDHNTTRCATAFHLVSRLLIAQLQFLQSADDYRSTFNTYSCHSRRLDTAIRLTYYPTIVSAPSARYHPDCRVFPARSAGQSEKIGRRVVTCCVGTNSDGTGYEE